MVILIFFLIIFSFLMKLHDGEKEGEKENPLNLVSNIALLI